MVTLDQNAPDWAQRLVKDLNNEFDAVLGLFVSKTAFLATAMPDATKNAWKLAFVSNGAANKFVAVSNGVAWYYLQGTAV